MDIKSKYNQILEELKAGKRPFFKLSPEEFHEVSLYLQKALDKRDKGEIQHALLILETVSSYSKIFDELLYKNIEIFMDDPEHIIFVLGSIQKQIIDRSTKEGERPPKGTFDLLRSLLMHKSPEVLEWALRTIEGLGPMSYSLKDDILKAKPSILGVFNSHKKASREIVDVILANWRAYGFKV